MREGIGKKYKEVKNDFLRFCKEKALKFLEGDMALLKKNLQNDVYAGMEQFM